MTDVLSQRGLNHERTAAGLAAARASSRHGGRPSVKTAPASRTCCHALTTPTPLSPGPRRRTRPLLSVGRAGRGRQPRMTAKVITEVAADILCVVEAEDRPALVRMNTDLRPHPRTHGRGAGRRPGPRPPRWPTASVDRPQAPGGAGDVSLWAVHRGGDRPGPGHQSCLHLSAPHWRQSLTNLSERGTDAEEEAVWPYPIACHVRTCDQSRPIRLPICGCRCPLGAMIDCC